MRRPSPSMVVALVALFIALGGTSYAVIKLPAKSVGNRELKSNAVTSAKIRAGTVSRADLAPSARTGSRGPRGSAGPAGPAGTPGDAIAPEAWKPLAFAGSWSNFSGSFSNGEYRRDQRGRVYLRGLVTKGAGGPGVGDVIATLPAGYRPPARANFAVATGAVNVADGFGRVGLYPNGEIAWDAGVAGETDYTSLETISFWTG